MESLAFIHAAANYENPISESQVRKFDGVNWNLAAPAVTGVAIVLATVGGASDGAIAATPTVETAATTTQAVTPLAQGSTGQAVEAVQKALGIDVDGNYGAKTEAAVIDFQIRQGLSVDGVVGKETAQAMGLDESYRPVAYGAVTTNSGIGLNIRSGPGINYRRIGGAEEGELLYTYGEVVDRYHTWQKIAPGQWVATNYVDYDYDEQYYDNGYYDNGYYDNGYYDNGYYDNGYYNDYSYEEVGYSNGGPDSYYVSTRSGIGLNVRSGPGLGYRRVGGYSDGSLVNVDESSVVYNDGYRWKQQSDGTWVASDYLYE